MRLFIFLIFLIISSCGYPDIDTVPDFKNLVLTEEDIFELCRFTNEDNNGLLKCVASYINEIPNFNNFDFTEEESIKLCKLINTDNKELIKCLVSFYENQDS